MNANRRVAAAGRGAGAGSAAPGGTINVAVLNPWFLGVFLGTAALCVVLAAVALADWSAPGASGVLAGGALYVFGCFLVTMRFNVPLNKRLAAVAPESRDGGELWMRYLSGWTAWNHVRTIASLLAAASFTLALL